MADKKNTSMWIETEAYTKLRVISAYKNLALGEVIKYLLTLVDDKGTVVVGKKTVEAEGVGR